MQPSRASLSVFFSVRIMGMFYFAVLTLSFSQLIYIIVFKWRSLTLGDDGIQGIPVPAFISTLESYAPFYYFALAVAAISIFIMWKITKSPFGMILRSARENPDRASFIGVDLRRYRLAAFTISAFFSGVAGVLFVLMERPSLRTCSNGASQGKSSLWAFSAACTSFQAPWSAPLLWCS